VRINIITFRHNQELFKFSSGPFCEKNSLSTACRIRHKVRTARTRSWHLLSEILQRNTKIELVTGELAILIKISQNWLSQLVKISCLYMLSEILQRRSMVLLGYGDANTQTDVGKVLLGTIIIRNCFFILPQFLQRNPTIQLRAGNIAPFLGLRIARFGPFIICDCFFQATEVCQCISPRHNCERATKLKNRN
jgi:hypothetical protein